MDNNKTFRIVATLQTISIVCLIGSSFFLSASINALNERISILEGKRADRSVAALQTQQIKKEKETEVKPKLTARWQPVKDWLYSAGHWQLICVETGKVEYIMKSTDGQVWYAYQDGAGLPTGHEYSSSKAAKDAITSHAVKRGFTVE